MGTENFGMINGTMVKASIMRHWSRLIGSIRMQQPQLSSPGGDAKRRYLRDSQKRRPDENPQMAIEPTANSEVCDDMRLNL